MSKRVLGWGIAALMATCALGNEALWGARPGGGRPGPGPGARPAGGGPASHAAAGQAGRGGSAGALSQGQLPSRSAATGQPTAQRFLNGSKARDGQTAQQAASQAQSRADGRRQAAYAWNSSRPEPFTPAWYADHPNAWKATHPHADAFVAATAVGLTAWLAAPVAVGGSSSAYASGTEETSAPADPPATQEAAPGNAAAPADGDDQWMPIGVFALMSSGEREASRVIQLAVNKEGALRGAQYDLITDRVEDVRGSVNKQDFQAVWTIGTSGPVAFEAPLAELTKPEGKVNARFSNGKTAAWQTVQVAK